MSDDLQYINTVDANCLCKLVYLQPVIKVTEKIMLIIFSICSSFVFGSKLLIKRLREV